MFQKRKAMSLKRLVMSLQLASLILLLSVIPYSAFGAPETIASVKQQILIDVPIKQYDASFAVAPKVVFYKLRYKKGITLVDIRSAKDFKRLRIPASINIPLHFIKSKTFLKPMSIVLVHEGFGYSRLISECRRLKALGFKISILDGGLPAWHRKGGRLVGDVLALNDMRDISPRQFLPERSYRNLLLIDVSQKQTAESIRILPRAVHLPDFMQSSSLQKSMWQMIEARRSRLFQTILMFNRTGKNYAEIKQMMGKKGIDAFYLQDGLSAYQKYLEDLTLSWKSRDSRTRTFSNCKRCGEQSETETFQPGK